jgi:mono/diheme cytochrome c family protein
MKGRVLAVQPIGEIKGWHKTSPDITPGGRMWTRWGGEAAVIKYLTTGIAPNGKPADPPMPAYKMKPADAEAVVEYLKTIK